MNNRLKILLTAICCAAWSVLPAQHFIGVTGGYNINTLSSSISEDLGSLKGFNTYGLVYKYYGGNWVGIQTGVNYSEKGYLRYIRIPEPVPDNLDKFRLEERSSRRFQVVEVPFVTQFHYELWLLRAMANVGLYGTYLLKDESVAIAPNAEVETMKYNNFDYGLRFGAGLALMLRPLEIQFEFNYSVGLGYLYDPHACPYTTYNRLSQMVFSTSIFIAF
jgi:hypothetical protein